MKKILFFLLVLLIITVFVRIYQLGETPVSMSDDEIREVYSAYSIWKTGKDVFGNFLPLSFNLDGFAYAPVPIYTTSPFVGILGLNMLSSRLPFALIGILTAFLVYLITESLYKDRTLSIISTFLFSTSLWHLQISRMAYEGGFSLFFYLLGTLLFLKKFRFSIFFSMLSLLLGFYSYSATKIIFLPLLLVLFWYKYKTLNRAEIITVILFTVITFFSFFILSKTQNASQYTGQFFFQNTTLTSTNVELERRISNAPGLFKEIYHNKITYWSKIFFSNYLYAFSPQFLFLNQEAAGIHSIGSRGQMDIITLPFLILGLFYLFSKKRKGVLFLLLMLIISPLPSGLGPNSPTYTLRSIFMIPWLYILVGAGVYSITSFIKNRNFVIIIYVFIVMFFMYSIGAYFTQYYYDWKVYGAKYASKSTKDAIGLILKEKNRKDNIVFAGSSQNTFLHYAFYSKLNPSVVQDKIKANPIKIDNITFRLECINNGMGNPRDFISKNSLHIAPPDCHKGIRESYKIQIKTLDGTEDAWRVFSN